MSAAMVEVSGVHKLFGTHEVLRGIDLRVAPGTVTVVLGPSGSGKSTLLRSINHLEKVDRGHVRVDGELIGYRQHGTRLHELGERQILRQRKNIGFVFQSFNLVPTLDVMGNILLPFELDGRKPTEAEGAWIDELVASLGLVDRLSHRPHELSGGQQQRVAIARALGTRPDLVFADEPTGNLDSRTGREVLSLLASASKDYGQSIAMVTHDPIAASYADRILFLADGRVVEDRGPSSPEQISSFMLGMEARA